MLYYESVKIENLIKINIFLFYTLFYIITEEAFHYVFKFFFFITYISKNNENIKKKYIIKNKNKIKYYSI